MEIIKQKTFTVKLYTDKCSEKNFVEIETCKVGGQYNFDTIDENFLLNQIKILTKENPALSSEYDIFVPELILTDSDYFMEKIFFFLTIFFDNKIFICKKIKIDKSLNLMINSFSPQSISYGFKLEWKAIIDELHYAAILENSPTQLLSNSNLKKIYYEQSDFIFCIKSYCTTDKDDISFKFKEFIQNDLLSNYRYYELNDIQNLKHYKHQYYIPAGIYKNNDILFHSSYLGKAIILDSYTRHPFFYNTISFSNFNDCDEFSWTVKIYAKIKSFKKLCLAEGPSNIICNDSDSINTNVSNTNFEYFQVEAIGYREYVRDNNLYNSKVLIKYKTTSSLVKIECKIINSTFVFKNLSETFNCFTVIFNSSQFNEIESNSIIGVKQKKTISYDNTNTITSESTLSFMQEINFLSSKSYKLDSIAPISIYFFLNNLSVSFIF